MKKPITTRYYQGIELISRWILGTVFIHSSLCKIYMPAQFLRAIHNYQLVPDSIGRLMAIVLPWIELNCGILLLIGLFTPGTIRVIAGLLALYIGAISIALIRGLDIDCGCMTNCFTGEEESRGLSSTLLLDFLYLALAWPVLFFHDRWLSIDHWRCKNCQKQNSTA